jgi:hypothetical protein
MATSVRFQVRGASASNVVPTASDLLLRELGVNPFAGVLFLKTSADDIKTFKPAGDIQIQDVSGLQTALGGKLTLVSPPASSSSTGAAGQVACDGDYFYICTAVNTWKRIALSTW